MGRFPNSGRGRGRGHDGRGRGGGRGYSQGRGNPKRQNSFKKPEMKFAPQTGGNFVHRTFATVKEHLVQQIQKTYKNGGDIAESLNKEEKIDLDKFEPTRTLSKKTAAGEETERVIEQEGLDIKYKVAIEQWSARRIDLERELTKAYSLIYQNFCTTACRAESRSTQNLKARFGTTRSSC